MAKNHYSNATARMIFDRLIELGVPRNAAIGSVGSLMGESGAQLESRSVNRGDGADGSDSIGIGQWNQGRATALKRTAASMGVPWQDPRAQVEHLVNELRGSHKHVLNALIRGPDTIESGERTWTTRYEVAGKPHHSRRIAHGYGFASALGEAPAQAPSQRAPLQLASLDPNFRLSPMPAPPNAPPQPTRVGAFTGFSGSMGGNSYVPRALDAYTPPEAPQVAPQAAPAPQMAPEPAPAMRPAMAAPTAPVPSMPQVPVLPPRPEGMGMSPAVPAGFLPQSFRDLAGMTGTDPDAAGARVGVVQVGGENDIRRATPGTDPYFGRSHDTPMTLYPPGDRVHIDADADAMPDTPAETQPLVVRGIRPKPAETMTAPTVPLPPKRPNDAELFPRIAPLPQAPANPGQPMPTGSTPTIFGANWHGPESGWINHAQKPAGTPYPEVYTGGNPYQGVDLLQMLGLR